MTTPPSTRTRPSPAGPRAPRPKPARANRPAPARAARPAPARAARPAPARANRPVIDPRIRQRRIEVARSAGRRRLRFVSWAIGAAALIAGSLAILHSPLIGVKHISTVGGLHVSAADIRAASGISIHEPMVDVSASSVDARLEAISWIASARTTLQWPFGVRIEVTERVPVAKFPARSGQWAMVDAAGRVLAITASPDPGLATVAGIKQMAALGSSLSATAGPALAVAQALKSGVSASVRSQISAIDQVSNSDVELHLAFGALADLGSADQLNEKLQALSTILARVSLANVKSIDVSVPQAPTLTRGP